MNADQERLALDALTGRVIGCVYAVSNYLGCGFLEKVYENALLLELRSAGLTAKAQYPVAVYYKNTMVGEYFVDILVNECIILELKACNALSPEHQSQCMNYLKATHLKVCLLINFGRAKVDIKRIVNQF
ncbi:GxxExxY protein [Methylophilus sp. YYY-1]|jgi:GxxExxY protein|uniref:GxxExxY protein n=1 Tax=Methylophilus glucosoxydans TaxID=752553 RepID=A0ABW3GHF4_9PROT|nr:GxxExxY protein [Methylophilus sp. YYY-1]MDF0377323.1 GxxExxY protein [Methylophilus sp. YYY-1]